MGAIWIAAEDLDVLFQKLVDADKVETIRLNELDEAVEGYLLRLSLDKHIIDQ